MDLKSEMQKLSCWIRQIGDFGLKILWHFIHMVVSLWYCMLGVAQVLESFLISSGILKRYHTLNIGKLRYLAIVVESEDAHQTSKVIELLQWLAALGVKRLCLYDSEGVLKKSKETILKKLNNSTLLEEADEDEPLLDQHMIIEFASFTDGKETVAKSAALLLLRLMKSRDLGCNQEEREFTEPQMLEALRAVGCRGPEPDLLLVYGPVRCHLGFPAWRIRYTEIVYMGRLNSMRYGALRKPIYKFTIVRQNYGK